MVDPYRAIWRVSGRRQVPLIVLAIAAVPLSYQKEIINLLERSPGLDDLDRLGAEMAAVLLLSLSPKWLLGYLSSTTGEGVIALIRRRIFDEFYVGGRRRTDAPGPGQLVTMVSAEAEDLGKFVGGALADPLVQFGTLVSVVGYIAATQPRLGLLAVLVIAPQAVVVLATQRRVNALVAERVRILRSVSSDLSAEGAVAEPEVQRAFDEIYDARRRTFLWKLTTKFAVSVMNGAGAVGVLMLGGWLVLNDRSDVGTVVAATIGLARLQQPWTQLIAFYRSVSAISVKFELLRATARPTGDRPRSEDVAADRTESDRDA